MTFKTNCPNGHQLKLLSATVLRFQGEVPIEPEGFDFLLVAHDTEDEQVGCLVDGCNYVGDLEYED